ncbi:natriuretic peptides A-like [Varanus komodoensis]|uniref:Natriuretic peptides A n=1 Tax=Varanus komodoensis TaxID=61221 RepID=A0A8D2IS21_VARKO|nr:natriuretic peptides A-like [Varanus komodoensis]
MGWTVPLLLALVLVGQPQGRIGAHPITGEELADFKDLLERLEDKLEPGVRDVGPGQVFDEPADEMVENASETSPSWEDGHVPPQREGGYGARLRPEALPAATRDKLRALSTFPRGIQRFSNCFGQRLDRIGAISGMGCGRRRN